MRHGEKHIMGTPSPASATLRPFERRSRTTSVFRSGRVATNYKIPASTARRCEGHIGHVFPRDRRDPP